MSGNVTVSMRSILVAALVGLALVAAYLLGGSRGSGPAQAADDPAPAAERPRVLTMTGTGEATAVPDQLSFALSVGVTRTDLDTALGAANGTMKRVLGVLEEHGVEKADVQTTGLSMRPVYEYHDNLPPTLVGYRVTERASVLVDELRRAGGAVSAAIAAGGNDVRVGGIRLLVGDTEGVMKRARDAAVAEATAKAEQYAAASGQELGEVRTLHEVEAKPLPITDQAYAQRSLDMAAGYKVPIRAGEEETSVTVEVVWDLR